MKRREFLTLLGGAAGWPLAVRAQQPTIPVVGFLDPRSLGPTEYLLRAFHQGLKDTGYVDGENVTFAYRFADGQFDRLPELATELVRRPVAVISASGIVAAFAAKAATTTIPIVFGVAEDPVKLGLVASLARPGGNLTGINFLTSESVSKRLALLHELVPATRVAVLVNPANATSTETTLRGVETAARAMGLQIQVLNATNSGEINSAFATLVSERPGANIADAFRLMGVTVGRILKGANLADLPVVQASKFELVINAETARMLGLTVPPTLLAIADEVIE